ncbi:MAG: GerMN domain-containing protein [Spirochaetaceae bacterium]|nr:GerMN domain-containing protein [Spirochaetaceae bacterium]
MKVFIFWLFFFVFIGCLFLINQERIRNTIKTAHFPTWFSKTVYAEQQKLPSQEESLAFPEEISRPFRGMSESYPADREAYSVPARGTAEAAAPAGEEPRISRDESPAPEPLSPEPAELPVNPAAAESPAPVRPSQETLPRTEALYFIRLDSEGTIGSVKVSRSLPQSEAPLTDILEALLKGPSAEEQNQNIISLIPEATRLLSVMTRLETAYINLSEDFLYTPYGSEAYSAQLQQLIWTATEFPSIKDVQLLIDGRKLDYLGDVTWIGSPLGRDAF